MKKKSENTVRITIEMARTAAKEWATPENLAWFDALTDEDIAKQIASNPDAAPELTDEWFENARFGYPVEGTEAGGLMCAAASSPSSLSVLKRSLK